MIWNEWGAAAFDRAKRERKPVFLHLATATSRVSATVDAVYERPQVAPLISRRFVAVRVTAEDRPDIVQRFGNRDGAPVILAPSGEALSTVSFFSPEDLAEALARCADAYAGGAEPSPHAPAAQAHGRPRPLPALEAAWPAAVLNGLRFDRADSHPCPDCLEFLLYAAREWKSNGIRERLKFQLSRLARGEAWDKKENVFARPDEVPRLDLNARLARLYLDAFALTGDESCREVGLKVAGTLLKAFLDDRVGAFKFVPEAAVRVFYADANAMAAVCLLRAAAVVKGGPWRETAGRALVFLTNMFDRERGMAHRWDGKAAIHGLLGDNAWAVLALTESFLSAGNRPHRELADAALRILFQQFWEEEAGGFLDRVPGEEDVPALKVLAMPGPLNSVALEGAWRLQHLKGNVHYGRWAAAALRSVIPAAGQTPSGERGTACASGGLASHGQDACASSSLARVQDMLSRGRMDLELVGRVGDAATDEMLAAVNRHYLPRRVVSFVDPDDQDFILPHKLKTLSWPKLFGCIDLKPKVEASRPDEVGALLDAIS